MLGSNKLIDNELTNAIMRMTISSKVVRSQHISIYQPDNIDDLVYVSKETCQLFKKFISCVENKLLAKRITPKNLHQICVLLDAEFDKRLYGPNGVPSELSEFVKDVIGLWNLVSSTIDVHLSHVQQGAINNLIIYQLDKWLNILEDEQLIKSLPHRDLLTICGKFIAARTQNTRCLAFAFKETKPYEATFFMNESIGLVKLHSQYLDELEQHHGIKSEIGRVIVLINQTWGFIFLKMLVNN